LLFSATISPDIKDLAGDILQSPQTVEVGERRNPVETVKQHFYAVPRELKTDVLVHALEAENMGSVLVFSRTKHGADKITRRLARKGINAVAIHSNRTQGQRERALEGFKRGEFRVLVATDIAARGIDVTGISHVINYDVPQYAEDYIHRIGRTGRAGATGDAVTFVSREEKDPLHRIERFIGKHFAVDPYPGAPTQASHADHPGEPAARGDHRSSRRTSSAGDRHSGRHEGRSRSTAHGGDERQKSHVVQERPQRQEQPQRQERPQRREGQGSGRRRQPAGRGKSGRKSSSTQGWSNYPR
jgi:ATP-dependent RNA helicase RhlE